MCIGICAIATQRGERKLWYKTGINSHSRIRKEYQLRDDVAMEQVNLEAKPTGHFLKDKWICNVDHDMSKSLPQWFLDEQDEIKDRFMEWVESEIKVIKKTKKYSGSLDLRGTQITALPEGLSVGGSLCLQGTQITALPEGLSVGDYLYLRGTQIKKTKVPKKLINKCIF